MTKKKIEQAIADIQAGKMVIITDDKNREDEGDLVLAAEKVTSDAINFMAHYGCGLICMPMSEAYFSRLDIPMMAQNNQAHFNTPFGVSIGSKNGITTGISAADRAYTIKLAANPESTAVDIVKPGHVFPLKARPGGVFERRGQTEGSVDLVQLAGFNPAAVICEIMNADGTMARAKELTTFSKKHRLVAISVQEIKEYRIQTEALVEKSASASLPTEFGLMQIHVYRSKLDDQEWIAVTSGEYQNGAAPLVRLHSQCLTGDILHSMRCDCGEQLQTSIKMIAEKNGILLYLPQEGRGIGLTNKIKAYALQDEKGLDTVQANEHMGFKPDEREYLIAAKILHDLKISNVQLITNNPHKISELEKYGITIKKRIALDSTLHDKNMKYVKTKQQKLGHFLPHENKDKH